MATHPRITRVRLEQYKSIAYCDVPLSALTFLVGPNAWGKSNFVDALRLVADALHTSLNQAVNERGGIDEVVCRAPGLVRVKGRPSHFSITLEMVLADGAIATYRFTLVSRTPGSYQIEAEDCEVRPVTTDGQPARFSRQLNKVTSNMTLAPPTVAPDRLYLVNASGLPEFRPVYDALSRMLFYNVDLKAVRAPQPIDAGLMLAANGSNIAGVLRRFEQSYPRINDRIQAYLEKIVPGLVSVRSRPVTQFLTLQFRIGSEDPSYTEDFSASSVSDGTLRALGILTALLQPGADGGPPTLIAIEEPEAALHPAATAVLLDALREASEDAQVIVTTHSPDILDNKEIESDAILAVAVQDGVTIIGRLDEADRSLLRDRLYTVGDLMRQGILQPAPGSDAVPLVASPAGVQ